MDSLTTKWIYDPEHKGKPLGPVSCFKRDFYSASGTVCLKISALGLYEVSINGNPVTEDLFTPGWCDYRKRAEFHSYVVNLKQGIHSIQAYLADGWYSGVIAGTLGAVPMLYIRIYLPDGTEITADTDWSCSSDGPFLYSDIYMGESYDANRSWKNWRTPAITEKAIVLEPFEGAPVRRFEHHVPQSVSGNIVDFGQNLTGREKLKITAKKNAKIIIRHAEVLNPDGTLYTENLRNSASTNRFIASGGTEIYEPHFTFHGFRYIEVTGAQKFQAEAVSIHSDFPLHLRFRSSNPLLDKLVENIRWGWLDNALDIPTDCPQRDERVGWLGDTQVFIRAALYLSDCTQFFRRWLKDVRLNRDDDGFFPIVAPHVKRFCTYNAAGWADAGVICPWSLYEFTGKKEILAENYDAMLQFVRIRWNEFQKGKLPDAPFGDWLNLDDDTPKELLGTAFLAYSNELTAKAAEILFHTEDHKRLQKWTDEVKTYFVEHFGERLNSQTSMVLALEFDLLPRELRAKTVEALCRHIRDQRNMHLATGFLGTPHLLHALSHNGHADMAWQLLEQTTCPSWLFPVLNGATTVWERWNSWSPENGFADPAMNSFNHYAYGSVLDWIIGEAAGIHPDFTIDPHPGGSLTYLEAEYRNLKVRWDKNGDDILYTITVPDNITAIFRGQILQPKQIYCIKEKLGDYITSKENECILQY